MVRSRKSRRGNNGTWKQWLFVFLSVAIIGGAAYLLQTNEAFRDLADKAQRYITAYLKDGSRARVSALKMTESNYGEEVEEIASKYGLPAPYLKALIVLECSGRKPVKPRYEKHIFKKLKRVRDQKGRTYEKIDQKAISDASDAALENLSRSWGPFQLMGYKCLQLDVEVGDIRGEDAIDWGAKWIKMEYGHLLKQKRYADAFHYHNTGRLFPKDSVVTTHDPQYVENGLRYIEYFD